MSLDSPNRLSHQLQSLRNKGLKSRGNASALVSCRRNNMPFAGGQLAVFQGGPSRTGGKAPISESYGSSEQGGKTANRPGGRDGGFLCNLRLAYCTSLRIFPLQPQKTNESSDSERDGMFASLCKFQAIGVRGRRSRSPRARRIVD